MATHLGKSHVLDAFYLKKKSNNDKLCYTTVKILIVNLNQLTE